MKLFLAIFLSTTANAYYDVSFLTINKIPTVEIIKNNKKCYVSVENFNKLNSNQIINLVNKKCKLK